MNTQTERNNKFCSFLKLYDDKRTLAQVQIFTANNLWTFKNVFTNT